MAKKYDYKKLTFEEMKAYIETNAAADKEWFKSVAIDEKGVYQHLKAKKAFAEKYMPDIIPVAKPKKQKQIYLLTGKSKGGI